MGSIFVINEKVLSLRSCHTAGAASQATAVGLVATCGVGHDEWSARYDRLRGTVDGRNPAPVDILNIPLFTGFYTSQVGQDFFPKQYDWYNMVQLD